MSYPRVEININKIKHNTSKLVTLCNEEDISVAGVTKVFCAYCDVVDAMIEGGVKFLADSRIENIKKYKDKEVPKLLLRLPMLSQVTEVVKYADISLNSEIETIKALSKEALNNNKKHKIILMIDLGDLREGILKEEEILKTVELITKLEGIKLIGLGTNLTCYGGIIPKEDNLSRLIDLKSSLENKYNLDLDIISGGNSSSLHLVKTKEIPKGINQLRLGESIILGRETAFGERLKDTYDDAFKLAVEIIEIKEKPSIPIGEIGMDAFGNKPTFEDKGIRKRALCGIGKQDIDVSDIIPDDKNISILGGSSDHLILDITDVDKNLKIGDKIYFKLTYGGILKAMTSEYVNKKTVR
ncbi:MAG: alanine/ornithine racemase family PLP-dependent enzyme [Firmicutes bacterium]|nr:alanine/ornithine racemase family PLP-dependent enzyme [Bacillota bacterium]